MMAKFVASVVLFVAVVFCVEGIWIPPPTQSPGASHAEPVYPNIQRNDHEDSSTCPDGLFANLKNCSTFIQCSNGLPYVMPCPKGLHYSARTERCERPCDAGCDRTYACRCGWQTCDSQICFLPNKAGPCNKTSERYYFDKRTAECVKFNYGGCRGNENNFLTEKECEKTCSESFSSESIDICRLPKETGPCKDYMRKYFFNRETGHCKKFIYGGCKGNRNNFDTKELCELRCLREMAPLSSMLDLDPADLADVADFECGKEELYPLEKNCSAFIQCTNGQPVVMPCPKGLHFSAKTKRCEQPCDAHCDRTLACRCNWKTCGKESCKVRPKTGSCSKFSPRYYYDRYSKHCRPFLYSGCLGNENNFITKKDCRKYCETKKAPLSSMLDLDPADLADVADFECGKEELYPLEKNCSAFIQCTNGQPVVMPCPKGLHFSAKTKRCEQPCDAHCDRTLACRCNWLTCEKASCKVRRENGSCSDFSVRFYYDIVYERCRPFLYTGCLGNENNFVTKEDCRKYCETKKAVERVQSGAEPECESPPEVGPCKAKVPRYYYDQKTKECTLFHYGGCGGNGNNYETINECQAQCWKKSVVESVAALPEYCELPPETGPCQANVTKFYYDHEEKECKEFQYGGCRGNLNSFYSKELCERKCKDKDNSMAKLTEEEEASVWDGVPGHCELKPETGPCLANITKFYYDHEAGECKEFQYGGCGGNLNSFFFKEICERKCKK